METQPIPIHAMPDSTVVPSHPWYYLDNFELVLDWVRVRYDDILTADERTFIAAFSALERPSRALLVRLVMRKGVLFRASKLHYPEIGNIHQAAQPLISLRWLDASSLLTLDELFHLHTKAELASIFGQQPAYAAVCACTKPMQLDHLRPHVPTALTYREWHDVGPTEPTAASGADTVYHLTIAALCERIRLMFFGNLRQDWTEFVLLDLGHFTYEKVAFPACARAFQTTADIDAYLHLSECKAQLGQATPDGMADIQATIPSCYANDWLEHRRGKLLFQIGQYHERRASWPDALGCYEASGAPGARARRIRVLERSNQHGAALALADTALQTPESEAEYQQVTRTATRLRRRIHGRSAIKPAGTPSIVRDTVVLPPPAPGDRVEHTVLQHLCRPGAPVFYTENALFNSLFGLLFWDAIFSAVPGAFFHPYQQGPADLHHPLFQRRREPAFSALAGQLDSGQYKETIIQNAKAKAGIQSPFVAWGVIEDGLLGMALDCIPAIHLKAVFQRLASDVRNNRAGMPDLVQFWPDQNRYEMVEVKGPGDRLQDNQLRWIAYFHEHDMPVRVCHVMFRDTL